MNSPQDKPGGVDLDTALNRAERDDAGRRLRAAGEALRPDPAFARQLEDRLLRAPATVTAPPRRWRLPILAPRRLGFAAAALLAVLALAAAAAPVFVPLLDQVFARNQRAARIDGRQLGRDLNLSQTVNGFTVTVGRVYADANQIVIGHTLTGPASRDYAVVAVSSAQGNGLPTLTDREGRSFPLAPGMVSSPAMTGNEQGSILYYETTGIAGTPDALTLRWTVEALRVRDRSDGPGTPPQLVPGPFVFEFTVPFEPGQTLALNRAIEAGGTTVTLERVVATPTGTRVYLRGAGPNVYADLTVDGTIYELRYPGPGRFIPQEWTPDSTWYFQTPEPLGDKRGEWTLVVRAGEQTRSLTAPKGGPWIFHFQMP